MFRLLLSVSRARITINQGARCRSGRLFDKALFCRRVDGTTSGDAAKALSDDAEMFTASSVFVNGKLKVDYAGGCAYLDENELHLTPIEYKLLCLLSKNVGKVLTIPL